jgi:hypothetical protein
VQFSESDAAAVERVSGQLNAFLAAASANKTVSRCQLFLRFLGLFLLFFFFFCCGAVLCSLLCVLKIPRVILFFLCCWMGLELRRLARRSRPVGSKCENRKLLVK